MRSHEEHFARRLIDSCATDAAKRPHFELAIPEPISRHPSHHGRKKDKSSNNTQNRWTFPWPRPFFEVWSPFLRADDVTWQRFTVASALELGACDELWAAILMNSVSILVLQRLL